ncbi:hypothetical protein CVV38_04485 [Candidatus Peregrinibacteria bacterium HGW-Peregrinibacteria-1]|jgi:LCP family protein required for cell wall assembly|nr:MAG: hypothetical protein CVV38_04485 [Candidatus Peregrinibacteria bacterium HGW-Peregrinibacteria-1]
MQFEKRRINKKKTVTITTGALLSTAVIAVLVFTIIKVISFFDVGVLLQAAGDKIKKDPYGHTNFLILGTGGENHDGGDLTDSMIIASMDTDNQFVSMLSIPRDLWVKSDTLGSFKINELYFQANRHYEDETLALNHTKEEIENIIGVPIHYWIKVDFKGFKEFIDAIGGIEVDVKADIYDPFYPKDGTILFEPFTIKKGLQHIDGETALKYARSRKTTSDFDRARRQQEIIFAIKEKLLSASSIFNIDRINNIMNTIRDNSATNITAGEILTLASYMKGLTSESISHHLIHDDQYQCGGFLYTPRRDLYNNLFVLVPAGGFDYIHQYANLTFNLQYIEPEAQELRIQILNGSKKGGVAVETKQILQRYCFNITRFGNARTQDLETTTYYYQQKFDEAGKEIDSRPKSLDFIKQLIPGVESTEIPQEYIDLGYFETSDLIIELGANYINSPQYWEDPFYNLPIYIAPSASTEETTTTNDNTTE